MKEKIKTLYDKTRSAMMTFEEVNNIINSISDKNFLNTKLKERLKEYSNTCLSDLLIFTDVLYNLLEAGDEIDLIFNDLFSEADDEDI